MRFEYLVIIGILLLSSYMYLEGFQNEVEYVTATLDHRTYLVRNLPDKGEAANSLARIRQTLMHVVNTLSQKYPKDERCRRMIFKFRPDNISESSDKGKYTSYSVNKGEKVIFCLRQRDEHNQLVNQNTMLFVALHELSHIMTKSVGHTEEFWDNFRFILREAIQMGLYHHQKFHQTPEPYCGTMITDTPLKSI